MRNVLVIPVLLFLLLLVSSGLSYGVYSYAFGRQYFCEISEEMLEKSPSWDERTDNPPLSAGKAIRLANAMKNKLVKDAKDFKWHLVSATLENDWSRDSDPGRKWWWSIRYEAHVRQGGETGIPNHLVVIVLMDGTVVQPEIRKDIFGN